MSALSKLDILHPNTIQRHGHSLIATIDQILLEGRTAEAPEILRPKHRKLMDEMRQLVQIKASEFSVEPALLASKRELESLILSPQGESLSERFLGWRKNVITNDLIVLKDKFS